MFAIIAYDKERHQRIIYTHADHKSEIRQHAMHNPNFSCEGRILRESIAMPLAPAGPRWPPLAPTGLGLY